MEPISTKWSIDPITGSLGVVTLLVASLLVALWFIRPRFASTTAVRWRRLALLRLVVIAILLLLALRPVFVRSVREELHESLLVLVDTSRSMSIADGSGEVTRWQGMRSCLDAASSTWETLPEHVSLSVVTFGQRAIEVKEGLSAIDWSVGPQDEETDLGGALQIALDRARQAEMRGVVLLSDGAQRAVAPASDAGQMATELARRGVPLIAVPFGKGRDQSQIRDVAVESLPETFSVYSKNLLTVTAGIRIAGYVGLPMGVQLRLVAADGRNTSRRYAAGPFARRR